jgi:hypothetical protein
MPFAVLLLQIERDPDQAVKIMLAMLPLLGLFILIGLAIVIVPFWFICKKAGFSPWLSLLNIVPLGNVVLLYVLAFADWKVAPASGASQLGHPSPPQG